MESPSHRRASLRLASFFLIAAAGSPVRAQAPDGRTNRVDYRIAAEVQDADRSLSGELWATWRNESGDEVQDLWFHLYLNAYSNNRTTHLTESRGRLRGHLLADGWGWQRVTRVTAARPGEEPVDVTSSFRYRRPDDQNPDDASVFSVDLPWAVGTGEAVVVHVVWESQLPRIRRRTGVKGDFIFLSHWFPKLAVYEGGRGWNAHQFHRDTEFYSNFGHYDVTLDLPAKYAQKVGASGTLVKGEVQDDRYVATFAAPSLADRKRADANGRPLAVHGFAWTADPDYVVLEADFKFKEWAARYGEEALIAEAALGRTRDELAGRDLVNMRLMIQPERVEQAERHFEATAAALFFYGLWWGTYPYEQVTIVDPAWGARAAGGMEYPTLFTCGTRLFTRPSMHSPESVTVHEAGHQFWYGLVANNEFEAAWLDEGFNSFTDAEVLARHYGPRVATTSYAKVPIDGVRLVPPKAGPTVLRRLGGHGWKLPYLDVRSSPAALGGLVGAWRDQPWLTLASQSTDPRHADRQRYLDRPDLDPIDRFGWDYADRTSYSVNSYGRTAASLRTLSGLVGNEAFLRGMRHYSDRWRFRHPYPDDFFEAFVEGSGQDVTWFFDEVFRGTGTIDWSVQVDQERVRERAGYFQSEPTSEFELWTDEEDEGTPWEALPGSGADSGEGALEPAVEPASGDDTNAAPDPGAADAEATTPIEPTESDAPAESDAPTESDPSAESDAPTESDLPVESEEGEPLPPEDEETWVTEILLERHGSLALPITVEIVFADDSRERLRWTREEQLERRWRRIERTGRKVRSVRLDPDSDYFIDADRSNDAWFDEADTLAPWRWSERVFSQVGHYLHWMSTVGG